MLRRPQAILRGYWPGFVPLNYPLMQKKKALLLHRLFPPRFAQKEIQNFIAIQLVDGHLANCCCPKLLGIHRSPPRFQHGTAWNLIQISWVHDWKFTLLAVSQPQVDWNRQPNIDILPVPKKYLLWYATPISWWIQNCKSDYILQESWYLQRYRFCPAKILDKILDSMKNHPTEIQFWHCIWFKCSFGYFI